MRPSVIAFDVNETLSDLSPLGARFLEVGASASAAPLWFACLLRDGFALTAAGENPPFAGVARELLLSQLAEAQLNRPLEDAVRHVMDGLASLELHADVANGIDRLLTSGNVRDRFERLLSVEDAGAWKPAARAYEYATQECDVKPEDMVLVAVHPWDVHGARRAGLQSAWVNRSGGAFPATFLEPTYTVSGVDQLAELWG